MYLICTSKVGLWHARGEHLDYMWDYIAWHTSGLYAEYVTILCGLCVIHNKPSGLFEGDAWIK